ncbi:MAG: hypothetical protein JW976_13665 [Syntrophaceae bacterium]|nr:hypothetical protein [Syntrophaceae bacterium]
MSEIENNENKNYIQEKNPILKESYYKSKKSHFSDFAEKISSSEQLRLLIIFLMPILVLLNYPVDSVDYDLWWHMALGKYYITHHTLTVDHSIFSWTSTDPTWIYNTCLGSIAIYLFYNLMGGFGLWLLHSLVFLGAFLSFYLFLRLIHQRLDINSITIIAAVAIACNPSCRYYKPELFSLLLFSWIVFIFFYIKISNRTFLFYLYPLIFALWVNLHGAFVVGLVFLAMAFTGEILNKIFFSKESFTAKNFVHFGSVIVLSLLATFFNPYGIDYLASTYTGITSKISAEMHNTYIVAYTSLWPYLKKVTDISFFSGGLTAWLMTLMILFVLILSIYELIKKKSFDFTVLIIGIALYWKGMETSRTSYFFSVAFFFIIFYLIVYRLRLADYLKRTAVFSLLIFVSFYVIIFYFNIRHGADNTWFGKGLDNFTPVEEVAFLKKYKMEGLIFNDYVIGGYLMWDLYPEYKVFIDPRCSPYEKQVLPDYLKFTNKQVNIEDIQRFRNKYPFKIVILHYRQMVLIFDFLKSKDDEWRLLYFGKNAAILIHKSLLSFVHPEAANVSLSPLRFSNVTSPNILINVFNFYVRLNPKAGRYIYNVFKRNVNDYYKLKPNILSAMDFDIKLKEKEFRDRAMWLSP